MIEDVISALFKLEKKEVILDIVRALVQRIFRDKIVAGIVIVFILGLFFAGTNKDGGSHRFISKDGREGAAETAMEGAPSGEAQSQGGEAAPGGEAGQAASAGEKHSKGFLGLSFLNFGHKEGENAGEQPAEGQAVQVANAPGATPGMSPGGQQPAGAGQQMPQQQAQPQQNPTALDPQLAIKFVRWWLTMALDYSVNAAASHKKAMAYAKPQVARTFTQSFYTQEVMQGIANGTLAGSFEPATVQAVAINPDGSVVVTVLGTLTMQSSGSQPVSQSLVLDFSVAKDAQGVRMTGFFNKTIAQPPPAAAAPVEEPVRQPVGF
ncbi:MAG: hypothetical protein JST01_17810 [Cyanobacteria bacterium SZAS TMP-1]|nr:hypothetical protein [Cyanobacteria bacterium SZAS TMP-1]